MSLLYLSKTRAFHSVETPRHWSKTSPPTGPRGVRRVPCRVPHGLGPTPQFRRAPSCVGEEGIRNGGVPKQWRFLRIQTTPNKNPSLRGASQDLPHMMGVWRAWINLHLSHLTRKHQQGVIYLDGRNKMPCPFIPKSYQLHYSSTHSKWNLNTTVSVGNICFCCNEHPP